MDIAGRLRSLEHKVNFLMDHMQMKAIVPSGVVDASGAPVPGRIITGSLNELYKLSKGLKVASEAAGDEAPEVENV